APRAPPRIPKKAADRRPETGPPTSTRENEPRAAPPLGSGAAGAARQASMLARSSRRNTEAPPSNKSPGKSPVTPSPPAPPYRRTLGAPRAQTARTRPGE